MNCECRQGSRPLERRSPRASVWMCWIAAVCCAGCAANGNSWSSRPSLSADRYSPSRPGQSGAASAAVANPAAAMPADGVRQAGAAAPYPRTSSARSAASRTDGWRPSEPASEPAAETLRQQSGEEVGVFDPERLQELKPKRVAGRLRQMTPWKRDEELARQKLQEADELFRQGKYADAASLYKTAAFRWPESIIEEDALFLRAECYFFLDKYPKASDLYEELLKKYDRTRHLDTVCTRQFAIARYWEDLDRAKPALFMQPNLTDKTRPLIGTTDRALECYQTVWINEPNHPLADDAVMATANNYFLRKRYNDADSYYDQLRSNYPRSEHLIDAHTLGLQAKVRTYQGAMYDATPLIKSEELAETMLDHLGTELGDEAPRVAETKQIIREQHADRLWRMAQYYHKNKYYGGERFYLNELLRDFSDTKLAETARERLQEIADRPDNPPQRIKKLLEKIPGRERN